MYHNSGRYQILSFIERYYSDRSDYSSGSQNVTVIIINNPPTSGLRMNPAYEQSTTNPSSRSHWNNIHQPRIDENFAQEIKNDVKRKATISGSIKRKNGEKVSHPQARRYQKNAPSTSSAPVQQPLINDDRSNRNTYINENVSDYDNDGINNVYSSDDGIRVYSTDGTSQEHLESSTESNILDNEEDLEYDDDFMTHDEQKELFEFLKDEEDLTPEQSCILGYFYESGIVVDKDYKQAFKHYKYASDNGDINAMCNLGYLYENGYNDQGVKSNEIDYPKAFKLYYEAAQQGSAQAQYNLATFYERGLGTKLNISAAIDFYELAATQDHHEAQANLAYLKYKREHYEEAYEYYLKAAKGGLPRALFSLGYLYQFGKGVKKNYPLAQSYYQEALDKGYLLAKNNLEIMEKNETDTEPLTINTNDGNYYDEYFNVGDACLGGINREQDIGLAYSYYVSEMKNNHGKGSMERGLGMYYQYCGVGGEEFQRALNLYLFSIELGHSASRYFLGVLLLQKQFFRTARIIFEKLLDQQSWNRNASYLFVKNENEFMNGRRPAPIFTTITGQKLLDKAELRYQQSRQLERNENKALGMI